MQKPKHKSRDGRKKEVSVGGAVARGVLFALLVLLALLALSAAIAMRSENPLSLIAPLSYTSALLSAFFCGFTSAKVRGKQGLLCGLAAGVGMLALFILGLLVCAGEGELHIPSLFIFYPALFSLSLIGGILGGARRVGRRRRIAR